MPKYIDRDFLRLFAHEVIRDVAVQTHTDFSKFLKPVIDRWEIELKIRNDQAIKLAKKEALEECVKLADEIEDEYASTEFNEWRAFKGFRNTLRDRLKNIHDK